MTLFARKTVAEDAPACVDLVNHIIALGGSTAYEEPFTETYFVNHYVNGAPVANVAVLGDRILGFQSAFWDDERYYYIGSFTDRRNPVKGAGRVMFEKTLADCRALGGEAIIAKITSDNVGGLAFYTRMGFEDWTVEPEAMTRSNGTVVDRVLKRFML